MSFEFSQDPDEKDLDRIREEISRLEDLLETAKSKLEYYDLRMKEHNEIQIIIDGLNEKLDALIEEDKKLSKDMPESNEEWDAFHSRFEHIQKIRDMLTKLYSEASVIMDDIRKHLTV